jgi:hypothetical protein
MCDKETIMDKLALAAKFLAWDSVDPEKHITFLHIPRTAGSSFRWAAASQYGNEGTGLIHPGYYTEEQVIEKQDHLKIITGHFDMSAEFIWGLREKSNLITILREPLHRFLSFYHYGSNMSSYVDHENMKTQKLEDLILDPNCVYHNGMCYTIGGVDHRGTVNNAYVKACEHLESLVTIFGFTELYPEMLAIMYRRFNWNGVVVKQAEYVPGGLKPTDLSADLLKILEKNNEADISLYNFALNLYEKRRLHWLR